MIDLGSAAPIPSSLLTERKPPKVTKKLFEEARARTKAFVENNNYPHYMYYGPTTDLYWEAPIRLLFVNLEAYGNFKGPVEVRDEVWDWLSSRTVRGSITISATVLAAIRGELPPTSDVKAVLRANYKDLALLERTLASVCYWNLRPTCNTKVRLDWAAVWDSAVNETAQYRIDELNALAPDVVIFSGKAAVPVMQRMGFVPDTFRFLETAKLGNVVYSSIYHPSRADYVIWAETVTQVASLLRAQMPEAA
jgi:hypothetical protein